ncbi:MAG: hypothetical protein WD066_20170 [Planctomycetaceae bacterium]
MRRCGSHRDRRTDCQSIRRDHWVEAALLRMVVRGWEVASARRTG